MTLQQTLEDQSFPIIAMTQQSPSIHTQPASTPISLAIEVQRWISDLQKFAILDPNTNFIHLGFEIPNAREFGLCIKNIIESLGIDN